MEKLNVIVEKAKDGRFACYVVEDLPNFALTGYGDCAEEAIEDMHTSLSEIRDIFKERGIVLPKYSFTYISMI